MDLKIGDKIIYKDEGGNSYKVDIISNDEELEKIKFLCINNDIEIVSLYHCCYEVEKINKILTESEKEYLSNIVKPFKEQVKYIKKVVEVKKSYVIIMLINDERICLPWFETSKYYINMEPVYPYTLKELGIN